MVVCGRCQRRMMMMMMMMTRKEMVELVAGRRDIASWDGNRLPWVGLSTWSVSRPYTGSIGRRSNKQVHIHMQQNERLYFGND